MAKPSDPSRASLDKRELDSLIAQGAADPSATRTMRCRTVARGRFAQLNYIRDLPPQRVIENEPEGLSGERVAPNASEALLAAFGSCLAVGIHANAVAQGIPIQSLELELAADLNSTAVWGAGDLTPKTIGFEVDPGVGAHRGECPACKSGSIGKTRDTVVASGKHTPQPGSSGCGAGPSLGGENLNASEDKIS